MSWLDALFGRQKPVKSQVESLFAITTSSVTLAVRFGLNPTGRAGICFKPVASSYFEAAEVEVKDLLRIAARESGTRIELAKDSYNFQWVVMDDKDFEDLVAATHMVSQTLAEHGFGEQLLAAVFQFLDAQRQPVYWIYNYKRGRFYPFVPTQGKQRDNAYELRLRAVMEKEMPVEQELERWYPLWDIPLQPR
ncbi:MAG: hypothetical protein HY675_04400 [Chloroflexi bacterium]|nr:hypothetical protein [Chloroflexota bacterium]